MDRVSTSASALMPDRFPRVMRATLRAPQASAEIDCSGSGLEKLPSSTRSPRAGICLIGYISRMDSRRGTVFGTEDGRVAIRFVRLLPHPPEKVWRAITDPAQLAVWFPAVVELDQPAGSELFFGVTAEQRRRYGMTDDPNHAPNGRMIPPLTARLSGVSAGTHLGGEAVERDAG